jgi:hypothetical protein
MILWYRPTNGIEHRAINRATPSAAPPTFWDDDEDHVVETLSSGISGPQAVGQTGERSPAVPDRGLSRHLESTSGTPRPSISGIPRPSDFWDHGRSWSTNRI